MNLICRSTKALALKWRRRQYWRAIFPLFLCILFLHSVNISFISKIRKNILVSYDEYNCGCPRMGRVVNSEDEESWCSTWSISRGPHQNVVSYIVYGDASKEAIVEHYYGQIADRVKEVTHFYPGLFSS